MKKTEQGSSKAVSGHGSLAAYGFGHPWWPTMDSLQISTTIGSLFPHRCGNGDRGGVFGGVFGGVLLGESVIFLYASLFRTIFSHLPQAQGTKCWTSRVQDTQNACCQKVWCQC